MKKFYLTVAVFALAVVLDASVLNRAVADESATTSIIPYGVEDVLRLARAKVAEETIVSFIQNSGTVYNLQANDIVYLRNEGVSDRVISAMLEQKRKFIEQSEQNAGAPVSSSPPAQQPAATQPAPVYVQPPVQTAPSSVYVIPYPAAPSAYYGYYGYYRPYPYYYPYYGGYWGPSISLGFGFGGGYHGHGFSHWGGSHGYYGHGGFGLRHR
jgi:hypothetical protein